MNIDKYTKTYHWLGELWLQPYDIAQMEYYTRFLWDIPTDAKVLEIGPWNGKFLLFLKDFYHLQESHISSLDISKWIYDAISSHPLTKNFQNHFGDSKEFLQKNTETFDLIVMKHVLEHMTKDYICDFLPILIQSLKKWGKVMIEVPNMANFPLGYVGFFSDFSHFTPFTDLSLRQAFVWNCEDNIDIKMHNMYIYPLNYKNPLTFLKSLVVKSIYYTFCRLLRVGYKFANHTFETTTTALLCVVTKK